MQHRVARAAAIGVAVSATIAMVLSSSSADALVRRPSTTRRVTTTRPPRTTTTRVPRSTTTRPVPSTTTVAAAGSEPVSTVPGTDTTVPGTPVSSSVPPASEPPRPSEPPKTEPPRPSEPPKTEPPRPSEPPKTEPTTTVKHDEPRTPATLTIRCALTERAVSCSWAGDAPGAAQFLLLRSGANVGRAFGPFDPATRTGVDPTIQPHQSYSYLVIARDGSGRTIAHSDPVVVTVP